MSRSDWSSCSFCWASAGDVVGRALLGVVLAAYLLVMGYTAGVVVERVRFDRNRAGVLRRHDDAVRRMHAWLT